MRFTVSGLPRQGGVRDRDEFTDLVGDLSSYISRTPSRREGRWRSQAVEERRLGAMGEGAVAELGGADHAASDVHVRLAHAGGDDTAFGLDRPGRKADAVTTDRARAPRLSR